jgi:hypothetical protein
MLPLKKGTKRWDTKNKCIINMKHWVTSKWFHTVNKKWYDLKDHNMAPKQWISIRNIIIYLEFKFCPNRRIFVFWRPFWIKNGSYSKPKWSPYGATCLTPCNYTFPLKFFHFWIFNNLFLFFFIFILVAILKLRPFWKF